MKIFDSGYIPIHFPEIPPDLLIGLMYVNVVFFSEVDRKGVGIYPSDEHIVIQLILLVVFFLLLNSHIISEASVPSFADSTVSVDKISEATHHETYDTRYTIGYFGGA
jgi:hypothetical protein